MLTAQNEHLTKTVLLIETKRQDLTEIVHILYITTR